MTERPSAKRAAALPVASIVFAICGGACAVAGYAMVLFPVLGAVLSFAGPLFASAAIVGGSIAVRRDRSGPTRTWRGTTGWIGRGLGILLWPPTLLIALTCGVLNASGTAYLQRRSEERAAAWIADQERGRIFWRRSGGDAPWSTPEMPWNLSEGESESDVQRTIRHVLEFGFAIASAFEHDEAEHDEAEHDEAEASDAAADTSDAGVAP